MNKKKYFLLVVCLSASSLMSGMDTRGSRSLSEAGSEHGLPSTPPRVLPPYVAQSPSTMGGFFAVTSRYLSKKTDSDTWLKISGLDEREAVETRRRYSVVAVALQEGRIPDEDDLDRARERASIGAKATLYLIEQMRNVFDGPTISTKNNEQALQLLLHSIIIDKVQGDQMPQTIRKTARLMRNNVRKNLEKSVSFFNQSKELYSDELLLSDDERE